MQETKLTIKIKGERKTYTQVEYVPESFAICKTNEKLIKLVEEAIESCKIEDIQSVTVISYIEV